MMRALALTLLFPVAATAAGPALSVGFADVDVSPTIGPKPVYMAGFGQDRKATKLHDPIMARATVLSDGTDRIALVSVDVVGLFLPAVEEVRKQLPGFRYVLVSSTHNHEAPDTLGLWGPSPVQSGVDPEYLKRVTDGAAEAVRKAADRLRPATAAVGTARGPELLHDGRLPKVLHDELTTVRFTAPGTGTEVGLLVVWNVHPELLDSRNTAVSADHVGYTVGELRRRHGCPVNYFSGTVGGLMTSLKVPLKDDAGTELRDGTFEKTERYGHKVADLADTALQAAAPANLLPFKLRAQSCLVPVENGLYKAASQIGVLKRTMYRWDGNPTPAAMAETTDLTKPVAVRSEVGYLSLGDLDVAAIPGEIYPELVLGKVQEPADPGADFPDAPAEPAVYGQMKGKHKVLIGLANDELGYIIPKRQWDAVKPFCYGLPKAQYGEINSVGPDGAPVLCGVFRGLAK
jgi:hypothetical protein